MPQVNSFADRIRWLRKSQDMTLRQLAERLGCDPGYLSKLESGKADNPSDVFLTSLFVNFHVGLKWMRSGVGGPYEEWAADLATRKALPDWSPDRIAAIMSVLNDLPDALGTDAVLGELLRETTLEEMQAIWRNLKCYTDLPVMARLFWNDAFMRFQLTRPAGKGGQKNLLTTVAASGKLGPVKSQLGNLLADVNRLTKEPGMKTKLADFLGAPLTSVSRWLSGEREPGGETTLRLLEWVQAEEANQKGSSGGAQTPPERKTQPQESVYEKPKSNPRKR